MEESNDLSNFHSNEHTFCGFRRRSSQLTVSEHSYYGMDESSDQTANSEDDDKCDVSTTSKGDCENDLHYSVKCQKSAVGGGGRLVGNIVTRLDRNGGNDNVFRNRSEWKKYYYHAVSRSMPIEEENEISAGPSSSTTTTYLFPDTSSNTVGEAETNFSTDNERDKHIIIHVNEFGFDNDDEKSRSNKKSIFKNDSSLVDYDSNAVTSV